MQARSWAQSGARRAMDEEPGFQRRRRQNAVVSSTYSDVDRSGDPAGAAAWMDEMATWPSVRAYKDRTLDVLRGVTPVVDVGCGVGNDARSIGAIGIDPSLTMVA